MPAPIAWLPVLTTLDQPSVARPAPRTNGHQWIVDPLAAGECRVYRASVDS